MMICMVNLNKRHMIQFSGCPIMHKSESVCCMVVSKFLCFQASSKKVITREEWEKKLIDVKIRKEDMNKLVMNFLVTEGYVDAAEKFRMESGTERILLFFFFLMPCYFSGCSGNIHFLTVRPILIDK